MHLDSLSLTSADDAVTLHLLQYSLKIIGLKVSCDQFVNTVNASEVSPSDLIDTWIAL